MSVVNAQFQDWKGNVYHFETSTDMIENLENEFAPLDHNHDERYYTEKEIDKMADDLKNCVVDGKNKIANAINDKTNDSQMSKDNTFDELAEEIKNIPIGRNGYNPYLYLCSLLDDSEFTGENKPHNHPIGYDNRSPESINSTSYRDGMRISSYGIEAGDGRVYSQWSCNKNIRYMADGNRSSIFTDTGFVPPPKLFDETNCFYIKPKQLLFCAVGSENNNNIIDYIQDGFIKVSTNSNAETKGKLVPLMHPVQQRILNMGISLSGISPTWVPQSVIGTIMVYQCQEAPLDINLLFKDYYCGTYILIPTYIYRKEVKKYDFPNMV